MKRIYELAILVEDKPVVFSMEVDESLKPNRLVDDATVCKWRGRLKAIAYAMFEKETVNDRT
jgi:hypothetical protein